MTGGSPGFCRAGLTAWRIRTGWHSPIPASRRDDGGGTGPDPPGGGVVIDEHAVGAGRPAVPGIPRDRSPISGIFGDDKLDL
nr:hypothetical protein GCM10010200_004550 [Actinomadura rugatobispora]